MFSDKKLLGMLSLNLTSVLGQLYYSKMFRPLSSISLQGLMHVFRKTPNFSSSQEIY